MSMRTVKGRKGRSTETASEGTFADILLRKGLGIDSVHIQNSYGRNGLPDRYLGRGVWIEFKSLLFTRKQWPRSRGSVMKLMRKSQKRTIPKLIAGGDTVHVCLFVHTEGEPARFIMGSYEDFMKWREYDIDEESVPWSPTSNSSLAYVKKFLDSHQVL